MHALFVHILKIFLSSKQQTHSRLLIRFPHEHQSVTINLDLSLKLTTISCLFVLQIIVVFNIGNQRLTIVRNYRHNKVCIQL